MMHCHNFVGIFVKAWSANLKSIKQAPRFIVAGDSIHLFTPFPWGISVVLSLSANKTPATAFATR